VKLATFLGSQYRDFYGLGPAPSRLDLIWRVQIGSGQTANLDPSKPPYVWSGTGWTGMPAVVRDGGRDYLLIGGYDHRLRKIDARTGRVLWAYDAGDVIKGSPSVFANPKPRGKADRYVAIEGSRRGFPLAIDDPAVAPYRAVAFGTGKELWRLPVPRTASYSRDCDGSGFYLDGRQYIGVESGWFYTVDPLVTEPWDGHRAPAILAERLLLGDATAQKAHGDNLVLEASPALMGDTIFIASGAGYVYGLRRSDLAVDFAYRTGSDLDGTTVPTTAGKLLVAVEKQYIPGRGGVLCLDPTLPADDAVVWFLPTADRHLGEWEGGVIGSVGVNDAYNGDGRQPRLAACVAVDGNLYLFSQDAVSGKRVDGPDGTTRYATPRVVATVPVGGGISTPIMVGDTLITTGYDRTVRMFRLTFRIADEKDPGALPCPDGKWRTVRLRQVASFAGGNSFESTPVLWGGRVYVGCRDGYFYCLGDR
jgi:outer membrane protein assembly factor BamB